MIEQGSLVNLSALLAQPKVLEAEAGKLQWSIARETVINRGIKGFTKYGVYFASMWVAGIIYPEEARLFRSGNFYWRDVDDIADKDKPFPPRYHTRQEYLGVKKATIQKLFFEPDAVVYGDRQDIMLADYFSVGRKLGIDLSQESLDILESIDIDVSRAEQRRLLTQKELDNYFGLLDPACIKGALKGAGESVDPEQFHPLSMAVRTFFNLRDFPKDFKDGLINISTEDISSYGVDLTQLEGKATIEQLLSYEPIRNWYQDQVVAGLDFLDQSRARLEKLELKPITRFVLWMHFTRPARKNLNKYARMLSY